MTILQCSPSRSMPALLLSLALLAPAPMLLHAQGMTAKVVPQPVLSPEILKLKRQLASLEKRVEELEKPDVEKPEDPDEAAKKEASDKAVERRLAALEKSAAADASKDEASKKEESAKPEEPEKAPAATKPNSGAKNPKQQNAANKKPTIIFAPFIVVDKSGRPMFRVDASAQGGTAAVYASAGGSPRAMMLADGQSGVINVMNQSGLTAASIESARSGAGRLVITDANANIVVEAGVTRKGIGIVRAGPGGEGPAGVIGGTVKLASSIQGRK